MFIFEFFGRVPRSSKESFGRVTSLCLDLGGSFAQVVLGCEWLVLFWVGAPVLFGETKVGKPASASAIFFCPEPFLI